MFFALKIIIFRGEYTFLKLVLALFENPELNIFRKNVKTFLIGPETLI